MALPDENPEDQTCKFPPLKMAPPLPAPDAATFVPPPPSAELFAKDESRMIAVEPWERNKPPPRPSPPCVPELTVG
jgi:hypothetical protein